MIKTSFHYYGVDSKNTMSVTNEYDKRLASLSEKVVKVTEDIIKDESFGVYSVNERMDGRAIWMLETSDSIRHPFATYAGALDWVLDNVDYDIIMASDDANSSNPDGLRSFRNRRRMHQPVVTIREEFLMR